jgi:OOP family OmpA-OmpF porin
MKSSKHLASALGLGGAILVASPLAHAEKGVLELDGFVGWHVFSNANDVGEPASAENAPDDGAIFGLRVGYYLFDRFQVGAELGIVPTNTEGDDDDDLTAFAYRLNLQYDFARIPDLGGTLALVIGAGGLTITDSDKHSGTTMTGAEAGTIFVPHAGFAAKVAIGDGWGLRFDGRTFLVPDNEAPDSTNSPLDWEATAAVYKHFGGSKKVEEPKEEPPPAPADGDGDGLNDDVDKCPAEAEDMDSFQDDDGCPDADNDGDGVPDAQDKAPNEPEDKDSFQDEDGAPEPDNDGDGFADAQDKCPNEAEDKDGFQDEDGCPDLDNDNDGVSDADDKCPDQLETKNGYQDTDGCTDEVPKAVAKFTGVIKGIQFDTGKATIKKASNKTLDAAVKVLVDYPDVKMEIQGHTDDVGDAESNRKLSQERADAVKAYFVGKGIPEDRLRTVGFGPDKPVDPAKTAKARALNRRVEFQLIGE